MAVIINIFIDIDTFLTYIPCILIQFISISNISSKYTSFGLHAVLKTGSTDDARGICYSTGTFNQPV